MAYGSLKPMLAFFACVPSFLQKQLLKNSSSKVESGFVLPTGPNRLLKCQFLSGVGSGSSSPLMPKQLLVGLFSCTSIQGTTPRLLPITPVSKIPPPVLLGIKELQSGERPKLCEPHITSHSFRKPRCSLKLQLRAHGKEMTGTAENPAPHQLQLPSPCFYVPSLTPSFSSSGQSLFAEDTKPELHKSAHHRAGR